MKIKRLEISGFKSFADRVTLDFQQGITGVVGPNGCGKSNIVDAIRWCMGEQSAKNLRGKAMGDVIFAGSESRKPLGVAEVSLIFSIEDGQAPAKYLDFSEIQITRRLYKDGESEYLLNKTPCRLMDITELFMDTGVGTRAYSIIEQGKIGQILHSRPEERRLLIEEAAGVTRFKARKQVAMKKIDSTRQNLLRLNDMIGEVKRQLVSLQRQAKKAEKFKELRQELRDLEARMLLHNGMLLQTEQHQADQQLYELNQRIQDADNKAELAENNTEITRIALLETEKQLNEARESLYRHRHETTACENGLMFREKELHNFDERIEQHRQELATLSASQRNAVAELEESKAKETELAQQQQQTTEQLTANQTRLQQAEAESGAVSSVIEQQRKELFALLGEAANCRSQSENTRKRLINLAEQKARYTQEQERLNLSRQQLAKKQAELENARQDCETQRSDAAMEIETLMVGERKLKQQAADAEQELAKQRNQLGQFTARLHSLAELEAAFEGYDQGVRNLLKNSSLAGELQGLLADKISVPTGLEAALEAALGNHLQTIICNGEQQALAALEHLRSTGGRARLFFNQPVNIEKTVHTLNDNRATSLLDYLEIIEGVSPLLCHLLAQTWLVEQLDIAIELGRKYPQATFVTRSGDLISFGCLLQGGSTEAVQHGILHKKQEIKSLQEKVSGLKTSVAAAEDSCRSLHEELHENSEQMHTAKTALQNMELELQSIAREYQQLMAETERVNDRLQLNRLDLDNFNDEEEMLAEELANLQDRTAKAETGSAELEQQLNQQLEAATAKQQMVELEREKTTALRVENARLREQQETMRQKTASLNNRITEYNQRMTQHQNSITDAAAQQQKLQAEITTENARLLELAKQQKETEAALATMGEAYQQVTAELNESESLFKSCQQKQQQLRQQQAAAALRCQTLVMQMENLVQTLNDRHRTSLHQLLEQWGDNQLDEQLATQRKKELEQSLSEMGEVNLLAIDECNEMEERFNFLDAQRIDLEESINDLQLAIAKINKTTRKRFFEAFNQINAKFGEIFPRLFCGGQAELRLTDEQDLLETGIDIIVQPPGKKLSNVMLLSGGEKALTAVALIFAIFLIKPTPFCLLDEVDAPLDDANIGRFNEMVHEMSEISQFIIITHNKTTMTVADTLYGITMEEAGASRLVSVKLH